MTHFISIKTHKTTTLARYAYNLWTIINFKCMIIMINNYKNQLFARKFLEVTHLYKGSTKTFLVKNNNKMPFFVFIMISNVHICNSLSHNTLQYSETMKWKMMIHDLLLLHENDKMISIYNLRKWLRSLGTPKWREKSMALTSVKKNHIMQLFFLWF